MAHPSAVRLIPDCRVSVDGKKLDIETDAGLTKVEVDLDIDLFGQCVLVFNDPAQKLINGKKFQSGTAVKVELGFVSKLKKVFEGEVVALEPQFRRDMPTSLRVVCLEGLHRLALSQMTRSFNDVDDKEIVGKIATEHGLTGDAPTGSKQHVLQGNITDATFLRRLTQKHGNHLRIEGKKLIVGPPHKGADLTLGPGDGLRRVKVRIQSADQIEEISVHGYDPRTKKEFVGKAKGQGETGEGSRKYGKGKTLSFAGHDEQPRDQATAEAMAKGRMRKLAQGHVVANIDSIGDPGMLPGATVHLEKMGAQIDGSYRVEKARHQFSKHGYYVSLKAVRVSKKTPAAKAQDKQAKAKQKQRQGAADDDKSKREDKRMRDRNRERQGAPKEKGPFAQKDTEFSASVSGEPQGDLVEAEVSGEPESEHADAEVSGEPHAEQADAEVSADEQAEPEEETTEVALPSVVATLEGVHFEFDKSFALPGAIPTWRGVLAFLKKEPTRSVLVVGHTDRTGDADYNLALSKERAEIAAAALRGDTSVWCAHYDHKEASKKWGAREDGWMLYALGFLAKEPKDAGADEIRAAVLSFQRKHTLDGNGEPTPATRKALVQQYLDLRGTSNIAVSSAVVLACGDRHPKESASDEELRRVEIYLFDGEIKPAADACRNAKHPGCTAYAAWRKEITGDVPPEAIPPGPQSTPDDQKYDGTQPRIAHVTDHEVVVRASDGTEHAVPRDQFETAWAPEARAETRGANTKYTDSYKEIALVSAPVPPANGLSIELQDAPFRDAIPELRVRRWLKAYKSNIVAAEKEWRVDRRAIAGAIAWEAMYNVQDGYASLGASQLARFSGPGKCHYKDSYLAEGAPLSKEVEDRGILPKQTEDARKQILSTVDGACRYIGASMHAFITIAAPAGYDLNQELAALLFMYNAWHLAKADADFKTKRAPAKLVYNQSPMATWFAKDANRLFVEGAVGKPDTPVSQSGKP